MLGFSRLSAAAYTVIARVVDEDGIFRARVAEAADEADLGRASWLWLFAFFVLLTTGDVTASVSPQDQYLHQTSALDTLGIDRPETECKF